MSHNTEVTEVIRNIPTDIDGTTEADAPAVRADPPAGTKIIATEDPVILMQRAVREGRRARIRESGDFALTSDTLADVRFSRSIALHQSTGCSYAEAVRRAAIGLEYRRSRGLE